MEAAALVGWIPYTDLLPLASIVSEGHHTTSEVALPLALNGIVTSYKIGLYTSLMPDRQGRQNNGANEIMDVLAKHQARSKYLLVYYEGGKIGGCVQFESTDMQVWNKIALANEALMVKVNAFAKEPTKENLASLDPSIGTTLKKGW